MAVLSLRSPTYGFSETFIVARLRDMCVKVSSELFLKHYNQYTLDIVLHSD